MKPLHEIFASSAADRSQQDLGRMARWLRGRNDLKIFHHLNLSTLKRIAKNIDLVEVDPGTIGQYSMIYRTIFLTHKSFIIHI